MMILFSIVLIILFFLIRNYKETIVVVAVLSQHLTMFYFPFLSINMFGPIAIIAIFLLPFKVHRKEIIGNKYPFKWMTILLFISYALPNISRCNFSSTISIFITTYVYLIVLWICLDSPGRVRLFVKTLTVLLVFHVLYGIYELISLSNPIMDYFYSKNMILIAPSASSNLRYGLKRIQSFSPYIGACGMISGMGFIVLLFIKMHFDRFVLLGNRIYILLVGLFICVFLTGTRSVFAGFAIGLLAFLNLKYFAKKSVVMSMLLFILISPFLYNYFSEYAGKIVESFLNTNSVSGSGSIMRQVQLSITLNYWKKSPVIGHGIGYTSSLLGNVNGLYGAESVWFPLLIDMGILGCASFILTILHPIVTLIKNGIAPIVFIALLFLSQKTLSSCPGISLGFHLLFVIFFLRLKEFAHKKTIGYKSEYV